MFTARFFYEVVFHMGIDRSRLYSIIVDYMDGSLGSFLEINQGFDDNTRSMPTFGSQVVSRILSEFSYIGNSFRYEIPIRDKTGDSVDIPIVFNAVCVVGGSSIVCSGGFDYVGRCVRVVMPFVLNEYCVPEWRLSPKYIVDVIVHELTHYITGVNKGKSVQGMKLSDKATVYYMEKLQEFRSQRNDDFRMMGTSVMSLLYYLHFNERNSYATGSAEFMGEYIDRIEDSIRALREVLPSRLGMGQVRFYYSEVKRIFDRDNMYGMYMPETYGKMMNFIDTNYRKLRKKMRRQQERSMMV